MIDKVQRYGIEVCLLLPSSQEGMGCWREDVLLDRSYPSLLHRSAYGCPRKDLRVQHITIAHFTLSHTTLLCSSNLGQVTTHGLVGGPYFTGSILFRHCSVCI